MSHTTKKESQFLEYSVAWLNESLAKLRTNFADNEFTSQACRKEWNRMLCEGDMVALTWPEVYGGRGFSTETLIAFHEQSATVRAPQPINSIAHSILAPTLLKFGTDEQKKRFLTGVKNGDDIWCQGYSEPGSGSDLASVRTRGVKTDGGWRVSGHKIWTTQAHLARWCFALVRTDPMTSDYRGLSFMLIDMHAPGVRVSPILQLTGEADYNEVFFEDVEVPDENIVGEVGKGWKIAMGAAEYERGIYFLPRVIQLEHEFRSLQAALYLRGHDDKARARLEHRVLELGDQCQVIRWRVERIIENVSRGETPGIDGTILKLLWSETRQMVVELHMELLDERAVVGPQAEGAYATDSTVVREFLWSRAETIVAGTSEIQRNIIGERLLGLPKDKV